jgi:hypothetical protein
MSGLSSLPPIDPAHEPAAIRNGPPAAKRAYQAALSFEQVLVDQLTKELAAGIGGKNDQADPGTSAYANLLPQAMTSSIMTSGGTGVAMQLAAALDPALRSKA